MFCWTECLYFFVPYTHTRKADYIFKRQIHEGITIYLSSPIPSAPPRSHNLTLPLHPHLSPRPPHRNAFLAKFGNTKLARWISRL